MQTTVSQSSTDAGQRIRSIAIVGGGTAGWITASMLARVLGGSGCNITLIESADIATVGVGEATIPPMIDFLQFLSINLTDFVQHTQATYKLGIKFTDWKSIGHSYWHPFGTFGENINSRPFYHAWQKAREDGISIKLNDFSLCATLGDQGKFRFPENSSSAVAGLRFSLHFDASLVAKYLRAYSERLGATRLERTVSAVTQREDGFIDELVFSDHSRLKADLYIDCSGFHGLLIEQSLKTGYLDWREWLPCDRAVAVQTELISARPSFTESFARSAGWRWRIPLQHRNGNGYVYSSAHTTDEAAANDLLSLIKEKHLTDLRVLKFTAGRRKLFWNRNCIAIGLSSGFLEPLESTSIHLVMSAVYKLLDHFPDLNFSQSNINSYNDESIAEMERIRDFIILHYCLTQREDTSLWRYCKFMKIPDSLAERIELYKATGRIRHKSDDLFTDLSWFYILEGMGIKPSAYDPLMDVAKSEQLKEILATISRDVRAAAMIAPSHDSFFGGTASKMMSMNVSSPLYAGVELGGTKCICVLGSGPHDIREQVSVVTGANPESTLSHIESVLRAWHHQHGAIAALGIASFGPLDLNLDSSMYGCITSTPKPGWRNTPIASRLMNVYRQLGLSSLPLGFDTDVNGAALAEGQWGATRGLANHAYITVGTGVGVGLVVNHQTVHGLSHPELGHIRIVRIQGDTWPGICPFHGDCVEGLISGPAIAARTGLHGAAIPGDHPVWQSVAHGLAQLLHVMVMSTAPQRIVVGGGVMNARPALLPRARQLLIASLNGYSQARELTAGIDDYIVAPQLGDQAGPLGALAVAMAATHSPT